MNIILIGYRCSGKTSIGEILSNELERAFMDTDRIIEARAGCSCYELVSRQGWESFRFIEKSVVENISEKNGLVVATGGGTVLNRENIVNLRRNGLIIWLRVDAEILKSRLAKEEKMGFKRPPLNGVNPMEEIVPLLKAREPLYEEASDITVECDAMGPAEAAARIRKLMPGEVERDAG